MVFNVQWVGTGRVREHVKDNGLQLIRRMAGPRDELE